MSKIVIDKVNKIYKINNKSNFYALNDINLTFDDTGLVAIIGKSGSGKSTLLNIIGGIDKPTSGNIYIDEDNLNKKKIKKTYYKNKIGLLFQNYNLLDDYSALENVMLPALINGNKKIEAEKKAIEALNYVGISTNKHKTKASVLSGGEKQRVALARSIINNPEILLCDEPTGALDSKNSKMVMDLLSNISKDRLVILVSHNLPLVERYSDRIIEIRDGKINKDILKNKAKHIKPNIDKKTKKNNSWIDMIASKNMKKKIKQNLFMGFSYIVGLSSLILTVGFILGKDKSIDEAIKKQFDYGAGSISKEEKIEGSGILSLNKSVRPTWEEVNKNELIKQNYNICPNFDAIFPAIMPISYDGVEIENLIFNPIYSFSDKSINRSLLSKGHFPTSDNLNEIVINQFAYSELNKIMKKDPLNEYLDVSSSISVNYVDFDDTYISDNFIFDRKMKIVGVVNEINYLPSNKIYYSYSSLLDFTLSYGLVNLSTYLNDDITWYDRIMEVDNSSPLSSYSYRLFLKEYDNYDALDTNSLNKNGLNYTSPSLLIRESLFGFMQVAEFGLDIFLVITLVGVILLLGIMSFASYSNDHKMSAILTCIGASQSEIENIYLTESVIVGFIATLISLGVGYGLQVLLNRIIGSYISISNLINFPFTSFLGLPFLLPLILLIGTLFISAFVTILPIEFSKANNLKGELQSL